jgi:hypothetical protein
MAHKPPLNLAESERMLSGRNEDAELFGFWFGLLKSSGMLVLVAAIIAAVTYLCIAVPIVGWAVAGGVLIYAISEISRVGKK